MEARGQAGRNAPRHVVLFTRRFRLIATGALLLTAAVFGQTPGAVQRVSQPRAQQGQPAGNFNLSAKAPTSTAQSKPPDFSAEPYVLLFTKASIAFQADGSYTSEITLRAKVQSAAGVQQLGVINAPYASATSKMQVVYVKVTKPDGTVVTTPTENVLDMPAPITQQAPFYSDLKVQQVAVKGLAVGDAIEYQFRETSIKPIDPGQFWYDINFDKDAVALDQEAEVSVPQGRYVKIQGPSLQPTLQQKDGRTIYTWKTAHLEGTGAAKDATPETAQEAMIQISTFHNWGEVGAWFSGLAVPQAVPTPDVRAKALELTKDAKTDQQKIEALYDFVSTKYRYIGIDFGIGRYQPHAASEVLANDYGDCKDKHTLLAALLAAVGIKAYPALISTGTDVDPEIPSPAQFDHVITAVPQGQGYLFLDTTPEVAPFGYLIAALRGKKTLVIPDQGTATLVQTPADPPFQSMFAFQSDGALTDTGEYHGKMHMTMRGDAELLFRLALRQIGESQWNTAVQGISSRFGFAGTTSDAYVSKLDDTQRPLEITYSYTRTEDGEWDKQISPFLPPVDLDAVPDESEKNPKPVKVGSPMVEDLLASIKLPDKADPMLPAAISSHNSFADYDASYTLSGGVLHVERKLTTKAREVPIDQFDAYRKFVKAVTNDESQLIPVYRPKNASTQSSNPEAEALFVKARTDLTEHDPQTALDDLQQAVTKDPNFAQAWFALGYNHVYMGNRAQGITEIKRAAALDPDGPVAKSAANYFQTIRSVEDALAIWRNIERQDPNDADAPAHIGDILVQQRKYSDALPELQSAAKLNPSNARVLLELSQSYFAAGDKDQGLANVQKAVMLDSSPLMLNNAAHDLADANMDLDDASKFAKEAVKDAELVANSVSLDKPSVNDLRASATIANYWDTLGWVYFQQGDFEDAADYLNAAWHATLQPLDAYQLGQAYERLGKTHDAVVAYRQAVVAGYGPDAQHRLDILRPGGRLQPDEQFTQTDLQDMRAFALPRIYSGSANAEFYVLLGPTNKVIDVKFTSGDEVLHQKGEEAVKNVKFNIPFPKGSSAQILRRGVINCEAVISRCTFVLVPAPNVSQ